MSATKITEQEALAMLAEAVNEPLDQLPLERERSSIAGWDSMGALLLIAEIDERFGLELSADESHKLTRVADVLAFLRKHQVLAD